MNTPEVTLLYPESPRNEASYHRSPPARSIHRIQNPISIGLATPRLFRSNRNFSFFEQNTSSRTHSTHYPHNQFYRQHPHLGHFSKHTSFDEDNRMIDVKRASELCLDRLGNNNPPSTSNTPNITSQQNQSIHQNQHFSNTNSCYNGTNSSTTSVNNNNNIFYNPNASNCVEKKRKILQFFSKMRRTKSSSKLNHEQREYCWNESMIDLDNLSSPIANGTSSTTNNDANHEILEETQNSLEEEEDPLQILYDHLNAGNTNSKTWMNDSRRQNVFPIIRELHNSIISGRRCQINQKNNAYFLISNKKSTEYDDADQIAETDEIIDKIYSCKESDLDSWISGLSQFLDSDHYRNTRKINRIVIWIQEIKSLPKNKQYFCTLSMDNVLVAQTPIKKMSDVLLFNEEIKIPVTGNPKNLRVDVWTIKNDKVKVFRNRSSSIFTFNQNDVYRQSKAFVDSSPIEKESNGDQNKDQANKRFSVPSVKEISDEMNESEKIVTCSSKISRKKKKSKKGCRKYSDDYCPMLCGHFEIPLENLTQNGDEFEDWFTLTPSIVFQSDYQAYHNVQTRKSFSLINGNNANSPTSAPPLQIRFRIKQRPLNVMTFKTYQDLYDFTNVSVNKSFLATLLTLEGNMSLKEKTELASLILEIHKGTENFKLILSELIINNIDNTSETSLILRGNSLASKAMEIYIKQTSMNYLKMTLGEIFSALFDPKNSDSPNAKQHRRRSSSQSHEKKIENSQAFGLQDLSKLRLDCEIDASRISSNGQKNLELILAKNRQNLLNVCQIIWQRIYDSHSYFPCELQDVFAEIRCRLCLSRLNKRSNRFPNEVNNNNQAEDPEILSLNAVSSCLFLRFICPAILNPYLFGLVDNIPENMNLMRTLTLVAKTIQSLANLCLLNSSKEEYMSCMNSFVSSKMNQMKNFLRIVSTSSHKIIKAKSICEESYDLNKTRVVSSRSMHTGLTEFSNEDRSNMEDSNGKRMNRHLNNLDDTNKNVKTFKNNNLMTNSVMTFNEHSRPNINEKLCVDLKNYEKIINHQNFDDDVKKNEALMRVDFNSCPIINLPACPQKYKVYSDARSLALATCHNLLSDLFKQNPKIRINHKFSKLCKILDQIDYLRDNPDEMNNYFARSRIYSIKEDFPTMKRDCVDYMRHSRPIFEQEIVGESIYDLPLNNNIETTGKTEDNCDLIDQKVIDQSIDRYISHPPRSSQTNLNTRKNISADCQKSFISMNNNCDKTPNTNSIVSNFDSLSTSGYNSSSNCPNPYTNSNSTNGHFKHTIESPLNNSKRCLSREMIDYDKMNKSQINTSPIEGNYFFPENTNLEHGKSLEGFHAKSPKSYNQKMYSYLNNNHHIQTSQYSFCSNNNNSTSAGTLQNLQQHPTDQSLRSNSTTSSSNNDFCQEKRMDPFYNPQKHYSNSDMNTSCTGVNNSSIIQTSLIDLKNEDDNDNKLIDNSEKLEALESSRRLALTRIRILANEQEHRELMKTLREELRRHDNYKLQPMNISHR